MKGIFIRHLLITLVLMALTLPLACAEPARPPTPTPAPSPAPTPAPAAEFEVSSLIITPSETIPDQPVTVSININNIGGTGGAYPITLTIDGVKAETKVVRVASQSTEKVSFVVIRDKPGIYSIGLNGLSGTFRVLKPTQFTTSNLAITPAEAEIGQIVTVTADVTNTGDIEGSYSVALTINGIQVETQDIVVAAGTTRTVTFTHAEDTVGLYCVEVGELAKLLTVKDADGLVYNSIIEAGLHHRDKDIIIYDITYMSDGLRVKGYLAKPKAAGTCPAIIWNRGGNREFGLLKSSSLSPYAQNGYVAIGSQYRGNAGGEGHEEFGGADINDVLNLIPLLKCMPNVDADRIGMVGFSRGGMMTYIALKEQTLRGTNDIKAACTVGGLADLFMGAKERPDMVSGVYTPLIGGSPSQVPKEYEARSATYWADKINVPLLIQHGEADWRVSVEQAEKLAQELEKYGKVYKLITYPDDDHGLSGHNGGLDEILKWLSQYLK